MRALIITIFAIMCFGTCQAQWAQGKGHAYLKLGSWNQSSNSVFQNNGKLNGDKFAYRTFSINSIFARVGIDSVWTATANVPLVYTSLRADENLAIDPNYNSTKLGDTNLSIERSLWNNNGFVGGAALTLGLPTGDTSIETGGTLATGDGEFNQMIRLLLGASYKISEQNFYWKGTAGYNHRTKNFKDEYRLSFETGTTIGKLFGLVRITSTQFFNDNDNEIVGVNFLAANFERINAGGEATYYFAPKFGVSVGYTHILSGKNIINAPALTAGLVHKF